MLENFQLAAIVKKGSKERLLCVPLHQPVQNDLARSWHIQHKDFVDGIDEIDFDAGYKPEAHERFRIQKFELPAWMSDENSQTIDSLDPITKNDELLEQVRGIAAFARLGGQEVVLFQNFNRSHVIEPGRFLFLQKDTYESTQKPSLALDRKLSAVYAPDTRTLLFHNFRTVNTFLPLANFYKEASETEIRDVLSHELLEPEDADALAVDSNQWFRKRFAMLRDSGVLNNYTAQQIRDHSDGYEVSVNVVDDKIVFPADKREAKRLLQFLNEEIFRGAITETLYETNSKREADT